MTFLWGEPLAWVVLQASLYYIAAQAESALLRLASQQHIRFVGTTIGMHPCRWLSDDVLFLQVNE